MKTTEAIVFIDTGQVEVQELSLPNIGSDDVVVEVEYSSISAGTERWVLCGKLHPPSAPVLAFPHAAGYQAAGIVVETGRNVDDIKAGDRVFTSMSRPAEGWPGSWWGGHMRYQVLARERVLKLPKNVSTFEASGLLLAQVGFNGATRPRIGVGSVALVLGDGLVGQYAGQVFRHQGARVIISGHHWERLNKALGYSADIIINSKEQDLTEWIRENNPGGVDIVAETTSKSDMIRAAAGFLRHDGQLVLMGYYPDEECLVNIHWVRGNELTLHFPNGFIQERLKKTLAMLAHGHIKLGDMVTHTVPYTEAADTYRMILEKSSEFLGIVFSWKRQKECTP